MGTRWLPWLFELADAADAMAMRYFQSQDLWVDSKPDRSLVTRADLDIETHVRAAAKTRGLAILGEEHGEDGGDHGAKIIVDPIDATANFARGLPLFATLLAIEEDGEIVAGVVSAPALHTRWHAERGHGAFAGAQRLRVSGVANVTDAQVFHGSLAGSEAVAMTNDVLALAQRSWRQRGLGDFYMHTMVAQGSGDLALDPMLKPWDIAPHIVLVEEAGGRATTMLGERNVYGGSLLSSNGVLHDEAVAYFRAAQEARDAQRS